MAQGSNDWKQAAPQKTLLQSLREGNAFAGHIYLPAVAGKVNFVQLYNPNGSGVEIYFHGATVGASDVGTVYIAPDSTMAGLLPYPEMQNRRLGGPLPHGQIRSNNKAATSDFYFYGQRLAALEYLYIDYLNIWIPEGHKINVEFDNPGEIFVATLTWYEFSDY